MRVHMKDSSGISICKIAVMAAVTMLLQPESASSSSGHQSGTQCQVRWIFVSRHYNGLDQPLKKTVVRSIGVVNSEESSSSIKSSNQYGIILKGSVKYMIVGLSASYSDSNTREETVTHLRGMQLTQSTVRTREYTVPPGTTVTVWQLVATFGGVSVQFEDFQFRKGSTPPESEGLHCRLEEVARKNSDTQVTTRINSDTRVATRINDDTRVRLRHKGTGMYLYAVDNKSITGYWQSVDLRPSQDSHFRLVRDNRNGYVRIVTMQPIWWGYANGGYDYRYAYCSYNNGVYFDEWSDNGKQLWRMSITDPVDGDVVTFWNKYYRSSALGFKKAVTPWIVIAAPSAAGSDGPSYCFPENSIVPRMSDHEWVIEVVR